VATEEFLTGSDWTASKLKNWTIVSKNPSFNKDTTNKELEAEREWKYNDYQKDSVQHQKMINEIYDDYHKNPAQYQNKSTYECLKQYMNPFDWRPATLIFISSNTESFLHLNDSVLLDWDFVRGLGAPLCDESKEMLAKCGSFDSFNSENLGTYTYKGNKIDYALYKAMDLAKPKVKTCYLQGSPQILMSTYSFQMLIA
jgi:hypothetical protein